MKRKWFRNIIGGLSLTSVLFVFQACYGTPQDFDFDLLIEGQVKSEATGLPIQGIQVSVNNGQFEKTNPDGQFQFWTERFDTLSISFEDIDSVQNGEYQQKDTVITDVPDSIYLDIKLEPK